MFRATVLVALPLLLLAACEEDRDPVGDNACGIPTDRYGPGMTVMSEGGNWDVSLLSSTPAPPDKGNNVWTVEITAEGEPVQGLDVRFESLMPEHGHGNTPPYVGADETEPGVYVSDAFDLFMSGVWVVRIHGAQDGVDVDAAEFAFCIEG